MLKTVCEFCCSLLGVCRMRTIEFLPPKKGHYLKNHVVSNITIGTSFRECEHHCLKTRECVSVNIGPTIDHKIICELTNSDDIQHLEDLIVRPGWTYVATEVGIADVEKEVNKKGQNTCLLSPGTTLLTNWSPALFIIR